MANLGPRIPFDRLLNLRYSYHRVVLCAMLAYTSFMNTQQRYLLES